MRRPFPRVFGAAGSGKTFLLVHKAVNAAREGKKVLFVCFNITMANYILDLVTRLARHYGPHYHRNIEVGHFHRFFPYLNENPEVDNRSMKEPVDVLLIDEGQDFERSWIEQLQIISASEYHLMFCEDDRQNIYGKSVENRGALPGIKGRVKDGWQVCQVLDELKLPKPQCNFESREEHNQLVAQCGQNRDMFKQKLDELRRRYKAGFWMQGGKIKVCTIHSFKGWELSNILVFFNPEEEQEQAKVPLLYTAITRNQQNLNIYNADVKLSQFGKIAVCENYIEQHPSTREIIPF